MTNARDDRYNWLEWGEAKPVEGGLTRAGSSFESTDRRQHLIQYVLVDADLLYFRLTLQLKGKSDVAAGKARHHQCAKRLLQGIHPAW